jgi:hypothetical protein
MQDCSSLEWAINSGARNLFFTFPTPLYLDSVYHENIRHWWLHPVAVPSKGHSVIAKLRKIALAQTRAVPGRFIRPRVVFLTSTGTSAETDVPRRVAEYARSLFSSSLSSSVNDPSMLSKLTAVIDEQRGFGAVFVWSSLQQLEREPVLHPRLFFSETTPPAETTATAAMPAEWIGVHERSLEDVRAHLYGLELRGANRHIVHSLRITAPAHLPKKRAVAEAWCRWIAKLATTRVALPGLGTKSSLQGREILDYSRDTFWQRHARQAILSCYDLSDWADGSAEFPSFWESTSGEPVLTAKNAARVIASLSSLRFLLRQSPRVIMRGLPRMATAVTVVSFAIDATKEHNAIRDFGAALIARAEAEWMRRLSLRHENVSENGPVNGAHK